jgi:hypothetical protein
METKKQEWRKYFYLGYNYPGVPEPWQPIIIETLKKIDKVVRPWYIPLFLMNFIKYMGFGDSVYYIKYRPWYYLHHKLTKGVLITDIKDKYAGLRIYGYFNDEIDKIIDWAEDECDKTCEKCGSRDDVENWSVNKGKGWLYNYCHDCRAEAQEIYDNRTNK